MVPRRRIRAALAGTLALAQSLLPAAASAQDPGRARPVIVLDPGHGGHDWGAAAAGLKEKEICLAIARKLQEKLRSEGGPLVSLTRDTDKFVRLDQRVGMSLSLDSDLFVSLHVNKVRSPRAQGITVYSFGSRSGRVRKVRRYRRGLRFLAVPPKEQSKRSASMAATLLSTLRAEGFRVDPLARAQYYVLKNPEHPSLLIEMGYLSNPREAALLNDAAYQEKLASALARGLREILAQPGDETDPGAVARLPAAAFNKPGP